jgi:hypothetical protein
MIVLISCTSGLILGSLIHYAFLENSLLCKGSPKSGRISAVFFALSIGVFLLTVYLLYLSVLPPFLLSLLGMLGAKLAWNVADSYRYAGQLFTALRHLGTNDHPTREFLKRARSYRQIQDLRTAARVMFAPGSRQFTLLESLITAATGNREAFSGSEDTLDRHT